MVGSAKVMRRRSVPVSLTPLCRGT